MDAAIDEYQRTIIGALTESAARSYAVGAKNGYDKMGLAYQRRGEAALKFAKEYGDLLTKEGASMIKEAVPPYTPKKIAWLKENEQLVRKQVTKTIAEGIEEGKPVASIGGKHVGEGTIAHDLQELLIREKAYENVRIARTEPARLQLEAANLQYQENGVLEITRLCGPNPCDLCAPLCGKKFPVKAAPGLLHPNGTCDNAPVIPLGGLHGSR